MKTAFQTRILAVVLAAATLAACVLAGLNFAAESSYDIPTDGLTWSETPAGLCALHVPAGSPGDRAGMRVGDIVQSVDDHATPRLSSFERRIFAAGIYAKARYTVVRSPAPCQLAAGAAHLDIPVYLDRVDRSINYGLRLIAVVYLLIGLYILFRRWTAPKSTHFFVFCLVSFVLYAFKYTGRLDGFDQVIYWANIAATALQPALFLHFAITFSDAVADRNQTRSQTRTQRRTPVSRAAIGLLYLPGLVLVALQVTAILRWSATQTLLHRLDKIAYAYMAVWYIWAAAIFFFRARTSASPLQRQQLKWLYRGTLVAVVPFTLFYVIPFLADWTVPNGIANLVRLSLVILPLTFSWAIIRFRLMDVDLIFKRGVTYTIATAALVGLYFGVVALVAEIIHTRLANLGSVGLVAAICIAGLTFDPLKRTIQARVDRVFDRRRFDFRETLVDFGRSLNAQTDLTTLVDSIVERLPQTLLVTRVAVFLATEPGAGSPLKSQPFDPIHPPSHFKLAASHGLTNLDAAALSRLDIGFLNLLDPFTSPDAPTHLFLENPQQVLRLEAPQREAAARLDLNYYLPCHVSNRAGGTRTVAVIGLGRTNDGDFLSSEDMEVLESLAGYIGIAIQNAQLYRRLEAKVNEFERLKDFNQNIVESINIGIFAVDLDDKVESWNSQMEVLFARPRADALRVNIADILPADFLTRFNGLKSEQGTHTLYKFRLALPTGETRTTNIAVAPLLTRNLRVIGRIILVDDITDQMQLESQLSQSEKLSSIGLLAAGVAHEVNTPLAVISSYTQMLSKQLRSEPAMATRLDPVLQKITQQTFRASEIVNGLLNFSRTSTTEFTRIDLNQILHDSTVLLDHQFKNARIKVTENLSPHLSPIQGNTGKLQQVVLNLMLNAKDAMFGASDGQLTLRSFADGSCACIEITDTGSGIAPEHLHRVFDPFFTTKTNPSAGQHKGTGLGLAVSYGILQEHGGTIKVQSAVGEGTTFRLEIPLVAPPPRPAQQVDSQPVSAGVL